MCCKKCGLETERAYCPKCKENEWDVPDIRQCHNSDSGQYGIITLIGLLIIMVLLLIRWFG